MTLRDLVRTVQRARVVVIVCLLIGLAAGLALSLAQPTRYRASSTLLVTAVPQETAASGQVANLLAQSRAQLLVELVTTDRVLDAAAVGLRPRPSIAELRAAVAATSEPGSNFMLVSATAESPRDAVERVTAVIAAARTAGQSIDATGAGETPASIRIELAAAPVLPSVPASPDPLRFGIVGGAIGGGAAMVLLVLSAALRHRVHTVQDVVDLDSFVEPVALNTTRRARARSTVVEESYGHLRDRLRAVLEPGAVVAVVSLGPSDGAAQSAALLSEAYRSAGAEVALVDPAGAPSGEAQGHAADVTVTVVRASRFEVDRISAAARAAGTVIVLRAGEVQPADLLVMIHRLRAAGARRIFCALDGVRSSEDAVATVAIAEPTPLGTST